MGDTVDDSVVTAGVDSDVEGDNDDVFNDLFGDDSMDEQFEGFSDSDSEFDTSEIENETPGPSTKKRRKSRPKSVPPGFDPKKWIDGDCEIPVLPPFTETPKINFDIPDNPSELNFLQYFITEKLYEEMRTQMNKYYRDFMSENSDKLGPRSRFHKWPVGGVTVNDIKQFMALSFYMGLVKKSDLEDYWSTDPVLHTPFPRSVMVRDMFENMYTFLHLCDNATYANKGEDGYDPRKKLGLFFTDLVQSFKSAWTPRQHLSIDEGCIGFKGRVSFKCYNPNKIEKYHMKTFKVVDSSNNYCLEFDLYVGKELNEPLTEFGKTHDLVIRMVRNYMNKSYIIFMDNWYSSPYLYYNLLLVQTGAIGTCRNRAGLPDKIIKEKLNRKGDTVVMNYDNKLIAAKYLDRKPVKLLSTVNNMAFVDTGKKHFRTKETIMKPDAIVQYNKYMGGVAANDQLLQYSGLCLQMVG